MNGHLVQKRVVGRRTWTNSCLGEVGARSFSDALKVFDARIGLHGDTDVHPRWQRGLFALDLKAKLILLSTDMHVQLDDPSPPRDQTAPNVVQDDGNGHLVQSFIVQVSKQSSPASSPASINISRPDHLEAITESR